MSSYGTRRSSAIQAGEASPIPMAGSPQLASSPLLSSSIGKSKRPSTINKARRLSNSASLRPPPGAGIIINNSLPASSSGYNSSSAAARQRSGSLSAAQPWPLEDGDDGEVKPGEKKKGQTYECEKCSKVYRHATCLSKHRWEHTTHWHSASKLLLSKHQQVQLLEAAAILNAASVGSSLPEEKSYWPAAVSPPSSGLLGSSLGLSFNSLGSPRNFQPASLRSDSAFEEESEIAVDEQDEDEDTSGASPSSADGELDDGMFDLDLGGGGSGSSTNGLGLEMGGVASGSSRSGSERSVGHDSGFGSLGGQVGTGKRLQFYVAEQ